MYCSMQKVGFRPASVLPGIRRTAWAQSRRNRLVILSADRMKVAITGAGGRTGSLVAKKLINQTDCFNPTAIVRSRESKKMLMDMGYGEDAVCLMDITAGTEDLEKAFQGCDAIVLATSGIPVKQPIPMLKSLWGRIRGIKISPEFKWKEDQTPERVDWIGGKNQIDAAKAAGVKRFIWVGSMGGTDPYNFFNKLGGNGNILNWKRQGEQYLMNSGLEYTIIHPAGLGMGEGGKKEIRVGVDDELLKLDEKMIGREDVAEACVQCLLTNEAANRAFDITSITGEPNLDMDMLLKAMTKNCDYTINSQLESA